MRCLLWWYCRLTRRRQYPSSSATRSSRLAPVICRNLNQVSFMWSDRIITCLVTSLKLKYWQYLHEINAEMLLQCTSSLLYGTKQEKLLGYGGIRYRMYDTVHILFCFTFSYYSACKLPITCTIYSNVARNDSYLRHLFQ